MKRILYITSAIFLNAVALNSQAAGGSSFGGDDSFGSPSPARFTPTSPMSDWGFSPFSAAGPVSSASSHGSVEGVFAGLSEEESTISAVSPRGSMGSFMEESVEEEPYIENNILEAFRKYTDGTWSEAEKDKRLASSIRDLDTYLLTFSEGEMPPIRIALQNTALPAGFFVMMLNEDGYTAHEITRAEIFYSGFFGRTRPEILEMLAAFDSVS